MGPTHSLLDGDGSEAHPADINPVASAANSQRARLRRGGITESSLARSVDGSMWGIVSSLRSGL